MSCKNINRYLATEGIIKNLKATLTLEGLELPEKMEDLTRRYLNDEITYEEAQRLMDEIVKLV